MATKKTLAIHRTNPTQKIERDREGGLLKFGGDPLGLTARGIFEGLVGSLRGNDIVVVKEFKEKLRSRSFPAGIQAK